jgi:quinol monooxygenase YgiN
MTSIEGAASAFLAKGKVDEFKQQAAEIIRQTKERDTKTLRYDWFLNGDQSACEVREVYKGSEGLVEHQMHVGEALNRLFAEAADNHAVRIYRNASPQLVEIANARKDVDVTWYSFLRGLEA